MYLGRQCKHKIYEILKAPNEIIKLNDFTFTFERKLCKMSFVGRLYIFCILPFGTIYQDRFPIDYLHSITFKSLGLYVLPKCLSENHIGF